MSNRVEVIEIPRDTSVPSGTITGPEWNAALGDIVDAKAEAQDATLLATVADNIYYNVMSPTKGPVAVGDGVTDDWAAIQHRLDNLPTAPNSARGGKVVLQPGHTYAISQTLVISNPNTDLDGIVGGSLTTMGACTIVPLPGFTGPLIQVNIPAGSKGAWIRNLRLDGLSEPGVTAGVEYAYGTISVAHMFDVAITNVDIGINAPEFTQSLIFERVLAFAGTRIGAYIGGRSYQIIFERCRLGGTEWGAVAGPDTYEPGVGSQMIMFNECELYANPGRPGGPEGVLFIGNVSNPRVTNSYIEASSSLTNVMDALVQVGSSAGGPRTPVITGNRLGGNSKAQWGVSIVNATNPFVVFNGNDTSLTAGLVRDVNQNASALHTGFTMGGPNPHQDRLLSTIKSQVGPGYDAFRAYVPGDTQPRVRIRASASEIALGGGSGVPDTRLYRVFPDTAGMAPGDSFYVEGTWSGGHFRMGNYRLWVDGSGQLRIKSGAPASDTDGTIVGSQG